MRIAVTVGHDQEGRLFARVLERLDFFSRVGGIGDRLLVDFKNDLTRLETLFAGVGARVDLRDHRTGFDRLLDLEAAA